MFKVGVFGSGNDTFGNYNGWPFCLRSIATIAQENGHYFKTLFKCSFVFVSRAQLLFSNCVYLRIPLVAAFSPVHSELDWRH